MCGVVCCPNKREPIPICYCGAKVRFTPVMTDVDQVDQHLHMVQPVHRVFFGCASRKSDGAIS